MSNQTKTTDPAWPYGYGFCHCGCGQETARAPQAMKATGQRKGDPNRYVKHHKWNQHHWVTVTCEHCGAKREFPPSQAKGRRFCSASCKAHVVSAVNLTDEARERSAVVTRKRTGTKNPNFRTGSRAGARDRDGERRFQSGQAECQHPSHVGLHDDLCQHHVVYRQHVEDAKGDIWDGRNALALCRSCHAAHHRRSNPLSLDSLRPENVEFARALLGAGADAYLRRRYTHPETVPRFPVQPALPTPTETTP